MRVRTTMAAFALAAVAVLATAATAAADGDDEPHGTITQTATSDDGPDRVGPFRGDNGSHGNWNSSPAFAPMTSD